jgi:hypothetical protein
MKKGTEVKIGFIPANVYKVLVHRTETRQTLVVQCASDSATGIADPQTGDAIRLAEDPPDTRHPFVELRHNAEGFSTLVFRRV